ncbi:MAG: asparagine synthase (glutamine-hydrolyzing) [Bacteroidia bacterium]|nr:asparagine synthase (glutamine-hydrolyzing) [Bacteroidia bacterium]
MCGIAGIWNQGGFEQQLLEKLTHALAHRGPDQYNFFSGDEGKLGLGHRRLSILDLSEAGRQPMTSPRKKLTMVFNGEVFNFVELKAQLEQKGFSFSTNTDSEVILAAYEYWGIDCLKKFNGMWALAIWDEDEKSLFLARDRFGIKPLYYYQDDARLLFASESQAFWRMGGIPRKIDEKLLNFALQRPNELDGRGLTIFEDIFQLLPGHFALLRPGERMVQKRWYNILEERIEVNENYPEQQEKFRELFEDACRIRLRADVNLATALSGGVDSTAVFSMVHKLGKGKVGLDRLPEDWQKAFVATFPGTPVDEKRFAEKVVAHFNSQAEYLVPNHQELPSKIVSTTKLFDAISSTPILSITPVYAAMREQGIAVSLDGHGVDEMLYGYRQMVYDALSYYNALGRKDQVGEIGKVLTQLEAEEKRADYWNNFEQQYLKGGRLSAVLGKVKQRILSFGGNKNVEAPVESPIWSESIDWDYIESKIPKADLYNFSSKNSLDQLVYTEFFQTTLPALLRNFDRASMFSGLEIRMPFMDYRLVEYAFSLPMESKLGGGFTKRILRDSMKGIMPEEIRTRTYKLGVGAPIVNWLSGPMKEMAQDVLHSQDFQESPFWKMAAFENGAWQGKHAKLFWRTLNAHLIQSPF